MASIRSATISISRCGNEGTDACRDAANEWVFPEAGPPCRTIHDAYVAASGNLTHFADVTAPPRSTPASRPCASTAWWLPPHVSRDAAGSPFIDRHGPATTVGHLPQTTDTVQPEVAATKDHLAIRLDAPDV